MNEKLYIILSNKSDIGDLSTYSVVARNKQEAYKLMQALMIKTAANCNPDDIVKMTSNSSEMEGIIVYKDDSNEVFRLIALDDITNVYQCDGIADTNLDAIIDEFDWDADGVNYSIFDIGREDS